MYETLIRTIIINLYFSHSLVEDTKRLVSSAGGTQEQLAQAARLAVKTIQMEAEHVKLGAMSLTTDDVEAQVSHYISLYMYISVSTRIIYMYVWYTIDPKSFLFGIAQFSHWARWHLNIMTLTALTLC